MTFFGMAARAAIVCALFATASGASAAMTTLHFKVRSDTLIDQIGQVAPSTYFEATFRLTFDNSMDYFEETAGLTMESVNIPTASPVVFTYISSIPALVVGAQPNSGVVVSGTDDFFFSVYFWNGNLSVQSFSLATPQNCCYIYMAQDGQITDLSASVPEPASWALMIAGFGLSGAACRRRQTRVRFA